MSQPPVSEPRVPQPRVPPESGRVALVTGASAGIGRACASRLATAGWAVTGASRRGTAGPGWTGSVMNVDDDDQVRAGVAELIQRHGRIDAVVTAAGWGIAGPAELTSIAEAKAQLETNFWGSVRVVQAVLPHMRAQRAGRIVLIGSLGGMIGIPFQAYYSASKFALEGFAEALGYEIAPFGLHVTVVQPGNVATDFTASRQLAAADGDAAYAAAAAKAIAVMERDEANGAPASQVAAAVLRVLDSRRPPRRVSVGRATERVGLVAKRVLPFRVFESAAKSSLGVD
jgi:NAD(P)-dependent dehydrogenase (short-subunit alcohol dehydrogenase family)